MWSSHSSVVTITVRNVDIVEEERTQEVLTGLSQTSAGLQVSLLYNLT